MWLHNDPHLKPEGGGVGFFAPETRPSSPWVSNTSPWLIAIARLGTVWIIFVGRLLHAGPVS